MIRITRVYTRSGDQGETALADASRVPKDALRVSCYGTVDELNSEIGFVRAVLEERGLHEGAERGEQVAPAAQENEPEAVHALPALDAALYTMQQRLFDLGAVLCRPMVDAKKGGANALEARWAEEVLWLERLSDTWNERLPTLRSFVLPGGGMLGAALHRARTVCRRAERTCVSLLRSMLQAAEPQAGLQAAELQAGLQATEPQAGLQATEPQAGSQAAELQAGLQTAELQAGPRAALRYLNRLSDALFVLSRAAAELCGRSETLWIPNTPLPESASPDGAKQSRRKAKLEPQR